MFTLINPMIKCSRRSDKSEMAEGMTRVPIIAHTEDSHMSHQSIKGQKSLEASRISSNGSNGTKETQTSHG